MPVALVMKVENNIISVFQKNNNQDNPYEIGDSEELERFRPFIVSMS